MDNILYLIKSGQAKQFFQQNMTFLAHPEGTIVTTRYKRRWVYHGEAENLPQQVLILFGEPPYRHLLPIRAARLLDYLWDERDGDFEYTLQLGALLALPEFERVDEYIAAHRPSENLLFAAPPPTLTRGEDSPQRRWNALVYHLSSAAYAAGQNPYQEALFAFVHKQEFPRALTTGTLYHQAITLLAPGLETAALRRVRVHAEAPVLDASVTVEGAAVNGQLRLAVRPLRALEHEWQTTLFFRPNDIASGQVILNFPPIREAPLPDSERDPYPQRQLFDWLSTRLAAADQLKLLERFLLPVRNGSDPDPHLLYARALLLYQEARPQDAVETLRQIPAEQRHDEMTVLLIEASIAAQHRLPLKTLLEQIVNWEDGQLAGRLVRAIAQLPEESEALELASELCRLAPNYAQRAWQEVGGAIRTPTRRLAFVEMLDEGHSSQPNGYLELPPAELFAYLVRDTEARRLPDAVLERAIVAGIGVNTLGGFAPYFMEWLERTLRGGDAIAVARAHGWFKQTRGALSTQQIEQGTRLLNDALKRVGAAEQAIWLVLDTVTEAIRENDLDSAERWLKLARDGISALPGDKRSDMAALVRGEDENIKRARHEVAASVAPRYGNEPGLSAILDLYQIDAIPAFWADVGVLLRTNPFVVQQLVERLEQLNKFVQEAGSTNAKIHSLSELQGNVYRLELSDQARVIFKKMGRRVRLISIYATHDTYDEAIKNRVELMNRLRQ